MDISPQLTIQKSSPDPSANLPNPLRRPSKITYRTFNDNPMMLAQWSRRLALVFGFLAAVLFTCVPVGEAFNVDTSSPWAHHGAQGSLFGFAVSQYRENDGVERSVLPKRGENFQLKGLKCRVINVIKFMYHLMDLSFGIQE